MNTKTSNIRNIAQARAKFAWERIKKNNSQDYSTMVSKLPSLIKTNGLLNTLAFLYSKEKNKALLDDLREWLTNPDYGVIRNQNLNNNDKLLEYLTDENKVSNKDLIQFTTELLELLNWMRRFSEKVDE